MRFAHHVLYFCLLPFDFLLQQGRVEVTGLRPLPFPHHRTCGLPHPVGGPSGLLFCLIGYTDKSGGWNQGRIPNQTEPISRLVHFFVSYERLRQKASALLCPP
jgi:hypothetical protein